MSYSEGTSAYTDGVASTCFLPPQAKPPYTLYVSRHRTGLNRRSGLFLVDGDMRD
jgi:hypothetical protein